MSDPTTSETARLSSLRMELLQLHPFWGHLLLTMRLVPSIGLGALAATDCWRTIWYDPERTQELSRKELGFVLAHELGHVLYASADRRRGRKRHLWNCATDYAINRIVAQIEHPGRPGEPLYTPPEGALLDARFGSQIAEVIYEHLASEQLALPTVVTLSLVGDPDGDPIQVRSALDHHGGIDVHLPRDLTAAERDELTSRVVTAVGAWRASSQRGDLPGALVESVRRARSRKTPWPQLLRTWLDAATGLDEYSLSRPNKRYLADELVVPGRYSDRLGHLVVAIDTSASMSPRQLSLVAAELRPLTALAVQSTVIIADAVVHRVIPGDRLEAFLLRGQFAGRGGTDHRPVFAWLKDNGVCPDLFVGLTDLYSKFPDRTPAYPVVWVTPVASGTAPFGHVIAMENLN